MPASKATQGGNRPFDDMLNLVSSMPEADMAARAAITASLEGQRGARASLGAFHDHLIWLAGWQKRAVPTVTRPLVAVFCGAHNVATTYAKIDIVAAAKQRVADLTQGPSTVRGVAAGHNMAYKVYEMGLEYPAADFTQDPSLSERDCAAAMAFGMEVVAEGADIIALGNAGFGSVTGAAAIALSLYGGAADYWANGDDANAAIRIDIVSKAYQAFKGDIKGPLDALRYFGGRDIAGLVGAIVAARHQSIPIVLDGFVVTVAAAILHAVDPRAVDHCIAGHITDEPAHAALLERIGLTPLLDVGLGRGDGLGAALAVNMLRMGTESYKTLAAL